MSRYSNPFEIGVSLREDTYYFLCSAGIGDTMLICGFYEYLLDKLGGVIHLLVKASHEFLMEMYGIQDYTVVNCENVNLMRLSSACPKPHRGSIFVAHPHAHRELEKFFRPIRNQYSTTRFVQWFLNFLDLPENLLLRPPHIIPSISVRMEALCQKIASIDQIILFSPEATSTVLLPQSHWECLAARLRSQGYTIVSNVIKPENCIKNTIFFPNLSSRDAVALGYHCHSVYSIRSGLCDALYQMGSRLHVFYPSHSSWFIYNMNEMFHRQDIDERVIIVPNNT